MRSKRKWLAGLVAGFVMGIVFVVACNQARRSGGDRGDDAGAVFDAGGDAQAQTDACGRWEVVRFVPAEVDVVGYLDQEETDPIYALPAGWEPFTDLYPAYSLRRCAD